MVLKLFHLVLKKYRKWFLEMCGHPDMYIQAVLPVLLNVS